MPDLEVFVDDSGDCETCLSFTALCMRSGTSAVARQRIDDDIEPLLKIFGLGQQFELHGTELLREGALKDYQREFFYRHCLDTIAGFPTLVIATVHWNWWPDPFRRAGQPAAWRHRLLWTRLLELLDRVAFLGYDEPHDITTVTSDRSTNEQRLLEAHDVYVRANSHSRILCQPNFLDSKSDRLLQATDLCAFAADLHARPFATGTNRRAKPESGENHDMALGWNWYPRVLRECFPEDVGGGGMWRLHGDDAKK